MLIKDFYTVVSKEKNEAGEYLYGVKLNPEHEIYKGHFPEKPITPGVCNILMIKELAESAMSRRFTLKTIDRCRLTAMVTPDGSPDLTVKIKISEDYSLNAEIFYDATTFMTLSGKLVTGF
ncbi:MAG: hypothetical protein II956_02350 [Bacteroidales bacterium]|nr:hypothetical protein [Bacteroidales bacterium]